MCNKFKSTKCDAHFYSVPFSLMLLNEILSNKQSLRDQEMFQVRLLVISLEHQA